MQPRRRGRPAGVVARAEEVRRARYQNGWTQHELARAASLTTRTIVAVESGRPVALATLRELARILGAELCSFCADAHDDADTS